MCHLGAWKLGIAIKKIVAIKLIQSFYHDMIQLEVNKQHWITALPQIAAVLVTIVAIMPILINGEASS